MKVQERWWVLVLLMIGTVWLLGCGQKKTESQAPQEATRRAQPPGGAAERGDSGDTITAAGDVAGIWAQITAEQEKLSAVIQNGQLKDVHHLAFGIRDLTVALADAASVHPPEAAPRLKGLVEQVKVSASDLGEMGDAGNLRGTELEFAKLNAILDAVKATVRSE